MSGWEDLPCPPEATPLRFVPIVLPLRLFRLKVIHACISLGVFAVIANILFQGQSLHWNHILAFFLIICAVYLVFMK